MNHGADPLESNAIDRITSSAKALASLCPSIGGIIGEVIGAIIPQQRIDRLTDYVRFLDIKVATIMDHTAKDRLRLPGYVDLFEDSIFSASRAASVDRLKYVAALVGNSLTPEHLDAVRQRRILWILDQLNDAEVIMLRYHAFPRHLQDAEGHKFAELYADILQPPTLYMGMAEKEYDDGAEANAIHDGYMLHLTQLHLIRARFETPSRGKLPEFDSDTGTMKISHHEITALGNMLLAEIDLNVERETQ